MPRAVPTQRARVVVIGDEPLVADGLALLLGRAGIAALHVESMDLAARLVEKAGADALAWVGVELDGETLERLGELRRARPGTGLCLVSHRAESLALERLVAESGERLAFVVRTDDLRSDDLVHVVRAVLRGYSTIDAELLQRLVATLEGGERYGLTEADHEMMALVAAGLRNGEIARRLWKSEKAIEKHVGRLFAKFGLAPERSRHLDRRVAATRIYLASREFRRRGLVEHPPFEALCAGGPEPPS